MFLHEVDERPVGLTVVGRVAVKAGNLVDNVRCEVRRRSRLRLGFEVPQGCRGGVCHLDVVLSEYLLQRFGEGRVVGEGDGESSQEVV